MRVMPLKLRPIGLAVLLAAFAIPNAAAQDAVVKRNVNLRQDPSRIESRMVFRERAQ